MKKLFAILICLSMMLSALPVFGETVSNEEAFIGGLTGLMNSFDIQRDQLAYSATSGGEIIAAETVKFDGNLFEFFVAAPQLPDGVTVQFNNEEIYAALSGTAFHLRFEEIPVILQSLVATMSQYVPQEYFEAVQKIDPDKLAEMGQLLLQRVMMNLKSEMTEDGMVISYEATGKDMLGMLASFVDDVLANEEYADTVKGLVTIGLFAAQNTSGSSDMPSADDLINGWPMIKQSLLSMETDFSFSAKLFMSNDGTAYTFECSAGVPANTISAKWDLKADMENGVISLDGKITQTIQYTADSEAQADSIDIHADVTQVGSMTSFNFTVDYPSQYLNLKLTGTDMGGAGKASLTVSMAGRSVFDANVIYAVSQDGLSIQAECSNMYQETYAAELTAAADRFILKATENGELALAAEAYLDDYGNVTSARLETADLKAEYDGEKLVVVYEGVTVTCTGEFESANAYVITMKAEGEHVEPDQDTAWIRVEYEGVEGNWALCAYVVEPAGSEIFRLDYVVTPTEPVVPLSETYADTLMEIDAAFVNQMVTMLLSQYTAIGE